MTSPSDDGTEGSFEPRPVPFAGTFSPSYQSSESPQAVIDREHLRLLRIGYFISAAQTALFIPFGLVYAGMGVMFAHLPGGGAGAGAGSPPAIMSWIFGIIGAGVAGFATLAAALKLLAAIRLKERRSRTLCLIAAGISCLEIPYGTALGVMTFIVLGRPSVRQEFESYR
jgi:hypothetical protein